MTSAVSIVSDTKQRSMRKRRKFYRGVVNHVYQRTCDGFHLFYTIEDCLVFYTIFSVCARSSPVQVLQLSIMHNHIHSMIRTDTVRELSQFMDRSSSWFAREYNFFVGRSGRLLKKNFGSAPKWDEKKIRSAIIYVGNNPVENGFCSTASESRWNFLAYAVSSNPFSKSLVKRNASYEMKKALKEVDIMVQLNLPLKYAQLIRMTRNLSKEEMEQFVDYVIVSYLPFDYEELVSHFKSFEDMMTAMDSTTGSEYDLKEGRDVFSLTAFNEIKYSLEHIMPRHEIRKVTVLPSEQKMKLIHDLQKQTSASEQQICDFLHIKRKM